MLPVGGINALLQRLLHQQYSEEEDILPEDEEEEEDDDALVAMELPAQESGNEELEQTTFIKQEEFAEIDRANENIEEELQDKKVGGSVLHFIFMFLVLALFQRFSAPPPPDRFPVLHERALQCLSVRPSPSICC